VSEIAARRAENGDSPFQRAAAAAAHTPAVIAPSSSGVQMYGGIA
jgi:hypothetical protein